MLGLGVCWRHLQKPLNADSHQNYDMKRQHEAIKRSNHMPSHGNLVRNLILLTEGSKRRLCKSTSAVIPAKLCLKAVLCEAQGEVVKR